MIDLNILHFSQLDNHHHPTGTCNVTAIAMCLHFFGIRGNGNGQLEDQIYRKMEELGLNRKSPYDLAQIVEHYGHRDRFTEHATWQEVKNWLSKGRPCVVHGWFTQSGHIIVIRGFNEQGFIVNDPYGEYWADGYDTQAHGGGLTYSYALMERCCGKDGDLWIHFLSKGKNAPTPLKQIDFSGTVTTAIDLIKQLEGLSLTAYDDGTGTLTIGYGHTATAKTGQNITTQQAEQLLKQDLQEVEKAIANLVKVPLTPNQHTALTSFIFNIGATQFRYSTLLKLLNQGRYKEAGEQLLRWNKANGQTLEGLTHRRQAEHRLFQTP
jgi:GH24 family phage-related lysozyme (muramidase)